MSSMPRVIVPAVPFVVPEAPMAHLTAAYVGWRGAERLIDSP